MNDADYAETPRLRVHRYASLGLVLLSIALPAWLDAGWTSHRAHVRAIFPLFLIWFPGQISGLAAHCGGIPRNADIIVRIVGWIGLILLLGFLYLRYLPWPEVR